MVRVVAQQLSGKNCLATCTPLRKLPLVNYPLVSARFRYEVNKHFGVDLVLHGQCRWATLSNTQKQPIVRSLFRPAIVGPEMAALMAAFFFGVPEIFLVLSTSMSLEHLEKWSESPCVFTVWGFSRNSRISKFSRISRKCTLLKRPL